MIVPALFLWMKKLPDSGDMCNLNTEDILALKPNDAGKSTLTLRLSNYLQNVPQVQMRVIPV